MNELLPFTLPQQDVYFEQLLYPDLPVNNIGAKIEIAGALDPGTMQLAFGHLIAQHATFRSIFRERDGQPHLEVLPAYDHPLLFKDFSRSPDPHRAAEDFMRGDFTEPVPVWSGQLMHQFYLVKVTDRLHYLYSKYHHLITDGWGTSLLYNRFTAFYNDLVRTGSVAQDYRPYDYAAFGKNDRDYRASAGYAADLAFWQHRLGDAPGELVPAAAGRNGHRPGSGQKSICLQREHYDRLAGRVASFGGSTFHLFLALLYTYFSRLYGQPDLTIGVPVLNRNTAAFKKTVGLFAGVLPLRIRFAGSGTFSQLVKHIQAELRTCYRHQRLPLGKIIGASGVLRGERSRLFDLFLSYEKHDYSASFLGTDCRVIPMSHGHEKMPLAVYVREFDAARNVQVDFNYNYAYFDEKRICSLTDHLEVLLREIADGNDAPIGQLNYLTGAEKQQLLHDFPTGQPGDPGGRSFLDLFYEQVGKFPERTALICGDTTFTYAALDNWSNACCAYLVERCGLAAGHKVCLLLDRSAWALVSMLAVLKAGAAYVPLDPGYPPDRLAYVLEKSGAPLLLTDADAPPAVAGMVTVGLAALRAGIAAGVAYPAPARRVAPGDSAYVLFTSGSTGRPKGVEIAHGSLYNFLRSMGKRLEISSADRLLAVTSFSFDISILELLLPLANGACVLLATTPVLRDPALLLGRLLHDRPTCMQATPSFWHMLFACGWRGDKGLKVLCGGELLPGPLGRKLLETCGPVWNLYGPTETTIWSTMNRLVHEDHAALIGRPIDNTSVYILDAHDALLPVGIPGEICIGGAGLAKGYLGDPELTAQQFRPHPFRPGERLYRTGDTGHWLPDGNIRIAGRKDRQVKLRGHRVELGEIEAALMQCPGVELAAVAVFGDPPYDTYLAAYCLLTPPATEATLRAYLAGRLPAYMIPEHFVGLRELPLTPNGKIDYKALPPPRTAGGAAPPAEPGNPLEGQLLDLWREVLAQDRISLADNFFAAGGQSIKAMQLVAGVSARFGVTIPFKAVFEHPTVRQLARFIAGAAAADDRPVVPVTGRPHYAVSGAQAELWVACQLPGASVAYHMAAAYRLAGDLRVSALAEALHQLGQRHEALRTAFVAMDGEPRQRVLEAHQAKVALEQADWRGRTYKPQDVQAAVVREANRPFSLEEAPLFRCLLLRLDADAYVIVFTVHHLVCDGWSVRILMQELESLYNAALGAAPVRLPALPFQHKDYVYWRQHQPEGPGADHRGRVGGMGRALPAAPPPRTEATRSWRGKKITFTLAPELVAGLDALGRQHQVTRFVTLLTVTRCLLYRSGGEPDTVIGTPVANRNHPGLESQVGFYVSTVTLRTLLAGADRFDEVLHRVKEQVLAAYGDGSPLFEKSAGGPGARDAAGGIRFDTLVALEEEEAHPPALRGIRATPFPFDRQTSRYDLAVVFTRQEQGLSGYAEFDPAAHSAAFIKHFIRNLAAFVKQAIHQPTLRIDAYDVPGYRPNKRNNAPFSEIDFNFEP